MLVIDLDNFKVVNDRLGHLAGDRVLCDVAGLLRAQVRGADAVYRYGGDEFVVLLHDTGTDEIRVIGERMRASVAASMTHVTVPVTISVGATRSCAPMDLESSSIDWLSRADAALYGAKAAGRNAVGFRSIGAVAGASTSAVASRGGAAIAPPGSRSRSRRERPRPSVSRRVTAAGPGVQAASPATRREHG